MYAGVTHPNSTRHHHAELAHTAAAAVAKECPRGACHAGSKPALGLGGGPAAFSEIQNTNFFGTSHFPCCITNFPQG